MGPRGGARDSYDFDARCQRRWGKGAEGGGRSGGGDPEDIWLLLTGETKDGVGKTERR